MLLSDNIYFAKAALQIGAERLETSLSELGFGETVPFEIGMTRSRFSNGEHMETEIQLADSGYGQGQILVNPLHLASMYSAFCNEGNLVQPWVVISPKPAAEGQQDGENESTAVQQDEAGYWIPGAFSRETAEQVLESLKGIVNDPGGTGYGAHREDVLLAGKTGTAEIKASQSDTSGTELGWMVLFTPEKTVNRPIMLVSMTEDVKGRGGSGYVVKKDKKILEFWFGGSGT
jgi:penicillin-binding protein